MQLDLKMTHEFMAPSWSLLVAPGWLSAQEEECATFWREEGVDALQISGYSHDSGSILEEILHDFAKGEFPESEGLKRASCGEFDGTGIDFVIDGKFWQKRWVQKGPLLLYISYHSDAQNQSVEANAVSQMLATLKSRRPAA